MGDVLAEQSGIERAMNKVAFAEPERIVAQHALLDSIGGIFWNQESFFNERPIRFHPGRMRQFGPYRKFSARCIEDPLGIAFARLIENHTAAGRGDGIQHDLLAVFDIEVISRGIHKNIMLTGRKLRELFFEALVLICRPRSTTGSTARG